MLQALPRVGDRSDEPASSQQHSARGLISLRGVVKEYEAATGPFPALKGIDLSIDAGDFVGIVGKSGSGKTTLMNMIAGLDRPTRGQIDVGDVAVSQLGEDDRAVWRGRNVGVVFQFFQLLPTISVLDNVMLPMDFDGRLSTRAQRERALHLLDAVDVGAVHARKLPSAMSGGQQQRVAVARALANDPPIIIADEPTGNLDSKTATTIFDLFARLAHEGKTVLIISHDLELIGRTNRTITLADGALVADVVTSRLADNLAGSGR